MKPTKDQLQKNVDVAAEVVTPPEVPAPSIEDITESLDNSPMWPAATNEAIKQQPEQNENEQPQQQ